MVRLSSVVLLASCWILAAVAGKADDDLQGRNALNIGNNLHFDTDDLKTDHRRFARQATTKKGTTTTKKAAAKTKKITGTTKKATTVKVTTKKSNLANAVTKKKATATTNKATTKKASVTTKKTNTQKAARTTKKATPPFKTTLFVWDPSWNRIPMTPPRPPNTTDSSPTTTPREEHDSTANEDNGKLEDPSEDNQPDYTTDSDQSDTKSGDNEDASGNEKIEVTSESWVDMPVGSGSTTRKALSRATTMKPNTTKRRVYVPYRQNRYFNLFGFNRRFWGQRWRWG